MANRGGNWFGVVCAVGFAVSAVQAIGAEGPKTVTKSMWDEHRVILLEHRYSPDRLVLKKGVPTHIRLENRGQVLHYFGSDTFFASVRFTMRKPTLTGYHLHVPPGKSVDLYIVPEKAGEFEFECFVPIHVRNGMYGTVVVKD